MLNKKTIALIFLLTFTPGQEKALISNVNIDLKQNGLFLLLNSTTALKMENITGWVKDGWFYLTIHNAWGDTINIESIPIAYPILDVQLTNQPESTQLAIQFKGQIDNYELYLTNDDQTLLVALYYPFEVVVAMIEAENAEQGRSTYSLQQRAINVAYLTGVALTFSGIIARDGNDSGKTEMVLGLIILGLSYFIDKTIYP